MDLSLRDLPARARALIFTVEAAAVAATTACVAIAMPRTPVTGSHWLRFAVLAVCVLAHLGLTRTVEKRRAAERRRTDGSPYQDFKSVWSIAAVLVLPPVLAFGIVAWSFVLAWMCVPQRNVTTPLRRWLYSAATVLLATCGALVVLLGWSAGAPAVLVACAVRWAVNYLLVVLVIAEVNPGRGPLFRDFREQIYSLGAMGVGICVAVLLTADPLYGVVALVVTVVLHRSTLITEYRWLATIDQKTGLTNDGWWNEQARTIIERARSTRTQVGVLFADVDHFKAVNDTHGHSAGDRVLTMVAEIIRNEVRHDQDIVGRLGGDEFAVLLPDVTAAQLRAVAERIRQRVADASTQVAGDRAVMVTMSIGAGIFPHDGESLAELEQCADSAMYLAKSDGRNQVRLAAGAADAS